MEIGSLFLLLALLILVVMYIARPLLEPQAVVHSPDEDRREHKISTLLAERDRILNGLQELDFDHALGKIPEEDYPAQRESLLRRGAIVLQRLDELDQVAPEEDAEAHIEVAVAERRAVAASLDEAAPAAEPFPASSDLDDEVEAQLAARRRARQDKSAGFCPQCGRPVQKSDRFCPKCGRPL
jgi:hypothetical protein